jgi:hypothetical protein
VTSIKRNGVAIKGKVTVHCTVITDYCNWYACWKEERLPGRTKPT